MEATNPNLHCRRHPAQPRWLLMLALLAALTSLSPAPAPAQPLQDTQRTPLLPPDPASPATSRRTRLILRDGSYQVVYSYQIIGSGPSAIVRYRSAERSSELEDVPLALVDLAATQRWQRAHQPGADPQDPNQDRRSVLSPELQQEEAQRAALTTLVAPNLRLPDGLSVLALDTFQGTPQLVPLPQQSSSLNPETAHDTLPVDINPLSSPHRLTELKRPSADVQLHVALPIFYVRIGSDDATPTGQALTVDTHGATASIPTGGSAGSDYALERLLPLQSSRLVSTFQPRWLGDRPQPDIIELHEEPLPGGKWLQLTPVRPLDFGEFALIELLGPQRINQDLWDFGIHPTAPENSEAIRPDLRRPAHLQPRP